MSEQMRQRPRFLISYPYSHLKEKYRQNYEEKLYSSYNVIPYQVIIQVWEQNEDIFQIFMVMKILPQYPSSENTEKWTSLKEESKQTNKKSKNETRNEDVVEGESQDNNYGLELENESRLCR